jgi:hypothetical protein
MRNEESGISTAKAKVERKKIIINSFPLFAIFAFAVLPSFVWAQNSEPPRIIVQSAPENPTAGSSWNLTILVDHPVPAEVDVRPPQFPAAFSQDRMLKEMRFVKGDDENYEKWTALEYSFFLSSAGSFILDAFEILTPQGIVFTVPVPITVMGVIPAKPKLFWEKLPSRLAIGDSAVFTLKMTGWPADLPVPLPAFFLPEIPRGVIIEAVPQIEYRAGEVLRLHCIPLENGIFFLPSRRLEYRGIVLDMPPINILITGH